jgi:glucose-1-phosphate cytidylyltransferase
MKVVLFCGGLGMRVRGADHDTPKPLVSIGDRPILWHVMRYYAHFGHTDFILCLGYKGKLIRDYFERNRSELYDWRIAFAETGPFASIGERLAQVKAHVEAEASFLANYADGLTDLHLPAMIDAFNQSRSIGAFICVRPSLSYHFVRTRRDGTVLELTGAQALDLRVNGGYFIFRRDIFDYIGDGEDLIEAPFRRLIAEGRLFGYQHDGFWKNMDTFKDKQALDKLCGGGQAPWEIWKGRGSGSGM